MSRPRTVQEAVHWLEMGAGARGIRLAAALAGGLALSLVVSWKQFHGPTSEITLLQADLGRQLANGAGFTTHVNFPQASAVLERRGSGFDAARLYPELYQAPLYPLVIGAALRLLPEGMRESLFAGAPIPPAGFGGDYFLLVLNVALFWAALWLTFDLGRRLFSPRVGWLASLGLLLSVTAWQQVVAVNGLPVMMVIALGAFRVWVSAEDAAGARALWIRLASLGALCGLLFLTEYSAGVLVLVATGWAMLRYRGRERTVGCLLIAGGFLAVSSPWAIRNLRLTGNPVALAAQNVALKSGDSTAEPSVFRSRLTAEMPSVDLRKLGNKALTGIQDNIRGHLWSGGGLFLSAFFVAGWLYTFRSRTANRIRWTFTVSLAVLVTAQAFLNSGESERLAVYWLAPLVMIFGSGFFFVLLESNMTLAAWPRLAATTLLVAQGLPLIQDALEPRRAHYDYPPYFPPLLVAVQQELEQRGTVGRFGTMADIPAGAAWYGSERVWAQPEELRDFHAISVLQPIAALILSPRTLDMPFFSELHAREPVRGLANVVSPERFGEWGEIYGGLLTGRMPPSFPLTENRKISDDLYLLLNPALPTTPRK